MAQKQNKNKTLLCTFRKCREPQDTNGEFCSKHYPKEDREYLKDALNRMDEMASQLTEDIEDLQQLEDDYNLLFEFISNSEKA